MVKAFPGFCFSAILASKRKQVVEGTISMALRLNKRNKEKTGGNSADSKSERVSNRLDRKIVAEDKPRPRHLRATSKIIFCIILVILLATGFIVWNSRRDNNPSDSKEVVIGNQCLSGKGYELAKKSVGVLAESGKEKELEKIVKGIQKIPGYEQDPVCLVPIVKYHIRTWKQEEAKDHLAKLEKVYDAQKVSDFYGLNYDVLADLKKAMKGLETAADTLNKGVIYPPLDNEKQQ